MSSLFVLVKQNFGCDICNGLGGYIVELIDINFVKG